MYELVVKNGTVVTEEGCQKIDFAVNDGKIAAMGIPGVLAGREELDASHCYVFPGGIDVHVHFDEPGFSDFEDFDRGSLAAAAGGITAAADMPIDCDPVNLNRNAFRMKKECAKASRIHCYYWAGLTDSNLEQMQELAEEGAAGYKIFLSETGSEEYPSASEGAVYEGLLFAASKGLPVVFHAENQNMIDFLSEKYSGPDMNWESWRQIRSVEGEAEAVHRAGFFAYHTGARIHIAHVSCLEAVDELVRWKQKGAKITAETCGHYLHFSEKDYDKKGALLKCAPPLRKEEEKDRLWKALMDGRIHMVSSDHSPCSEEMLLDQNVQTAWAGISGIQFTVNVLYQDGVLKRNMPVEHLAKVFSANPARLLGIYGKKGVIAPGADADFFIFDPAETWTVERESLFTKVKSSPYLGEQFQGRVIATFAEGRKVYEVTRSNES